MEITCLTINPFLEKQHVISRIDVLESLKSRGDQNGELNDSHLDQRQRHHREGVSDCSYSARRPGHGRVHQKGSGALGS